MPASFSRFLSSGVWELTAEGSKRFLVHEDVLASQSQRLKDIIDAFTAAESTPKREIPLDNWDADTVGRFAEYVYTGDYQSPDPRIPSTPITTPTESVQSTSNEGSSAGSSPTEAEKREDFPLAPPVRPLTPLSKCFPAGPDPPRKRSAAEKFAHEYFDPREHDFEDLFLAHAKVFALAQEFEMNELQTLAVQRLLRTFLNIGAFQPEWPVASNFVELARYAYSGSNPSNTDLRHVVSQFAALNFTNLQTEEMKALIEQSGRFARDLNAKVCRRLIVAEKTQDNERKELKELKLQLHAMKAELEDELDQVVTKKPSPTRSANPLAHRKPAKNGTSPFVYSLDATQPSSGGAFVKVPPPPPNRIFPGTNAFGTLTAAVGASSLAAPVASAGNRFGGTDYYSTSSQPGAKSIFEKSEVPAGSSGLFPESGAKSIFATNKTPARSSSSFGLFYTPPQSRSTSAMGMARPLETTSSLDPVKQPTPSSSVFSSFPPEKSPRLDVFGQPIEANGFSTSSSMTTQFGGAQVAPTAPLFGPPKVALKGLFGQEAANIFAPK